MAGGSSRASAAHHNLRLPSDWLAQTRVMKTLILAFAVTTGLAAQQPFRFQVTGNGRPMILIPGLSCPGQVWDGTVARYKDRYEMHVLSLAGFAGVPRVPGPFLDTARSYRGLHSQEPPVASDHRRTQPRRISRARYRD